MKTPCKISEPYDNPFWEKSNPAEREREERENNAVNSGHFVYVTAHATTRTKICSRIEGPGAMCSATEAWKKQPGMDNWCTTNCNHVPSNCPADICECEP